MAEGARLLVYGATGHLGRDLCAELVSRGADLALAGRDGEKLAHVAAEHAAGAPTHVVAVDDEHGLRRLLEGFAVVVNLAGPFGPLAEPVVRAAIGSRTHYVDATGEQPFIRRVFQGYGDAAGRAGTALVPAAGFDYAVGDCAARLAARGHEPLDELTVAYALEGSGVSGGSMRGSVEAPRGGEVVYTDGSWRPARLGVHRASFPFPAPIGRQPVSRYGSGEILTVPTHTQVRTVKSVITTSAFVPHPALVPVFPYLRPVVAVALRTPLRRLLTLVTARLGGEPTGEDRDTSAFTIVARARGADGSSGSAIVRGRDFYRVTAATLAHTACSLATNPPARRGALGPAVATDPRALLEGLEAHGTSFLVT